MAILLWQPLWPVYNIMYTTLINPDLREKRSGLTAPIAQEKRWRSEKKAFLCRRTCGILNLQVPVVKIEKREEYEVLEGEEYGNRDQRVCGNDGG